MNKLDVGQHSAGAGQSCHMKMSLQIKEPSKQHICQEQDELKCYLKSKNSIQMKVIQLRGAVYSMSGKTGVSKVEDNKKSMLTWD